MYGRCNELLNRVFMRYFSSNLQLGAPSCVGVFARVILWDILGMVLGGFDSLTHGYVNEFRR